MNRIWGFIYVLLSGLGFGFLGIFGRWAYQAEMSIGELLTFRFLTAATLLWIYLIVFRRKLIRLSFQQILISAALGFFGYAVFSSFYFLAIRGLSVSLAALLLFTFPIFVNLGAHFFLKERISRRQVLSLFVTFLGMLILLWGPFTYDSLKAVGFGTASGLTYAIYVLASGRFQKNVPPLSSSVYVITAATIGLALFHQPNFHRLLEFNSHQLLIIIGIACISTIAPLTLFLAGLQKLSSSQASIIVMIEPVVATMAAWILLGEQLSTLQLTGASLVLVGLIINTLR